MSPRLLLDAERIQVGPRVESVDRKISEFGFYTSHVISNGTLESGHTHSGIEILYVRRGLMEFVSEGSRHAVPGGCLVVLDGETLHASKPLAEPYERIALNVSPAYAPPHFLRAAERSFAKGRALAFRVDHHVDRLMCGIHERMRGNPSGRPAEDVGPIFGRLDPCANRLPAPPPLLWDAIALMKQYQARDIPLEHLARHLYCSESYLYKLFRTYLNCSPKQYWTHLSLIRACELLRSSKTVSEAARAVGYASARGLQAAFRRVRGIPPSEYHRFDQSSSGITTAKPR